MNSTIAKAALLINSKESAVWFMNFLCSKDWMNICLEQHWKQPLKEKTNNSLAFLYCTVLLCAKYTSLHHPDICTIYKVNATFYLHFLLRALNSTRKFHHRLIYSLSTIVLATVDHIAGHKFPLYVA